MRPARPFVLCYHAISSSWPSPLAVTIPDLRTRLERLKAYGYVGLTFAEAERRRRAGTLPAKTVVVTFDDAYRSVNEARPVLESLDFPATVYAVGAYLDEARLLEWPGIEDWLETPHRHELRCLGRQELLELRDGGWEIGSHTMTHARLPQLDDESCRDELVRSRELITEIFGRCETVAYPYGAADARVARLAAEAGYLAGCTLSYAHRVDEPFRRPRFDASAAGGRLRQWAKLSAPGRALRRSPLATLRR